MEFQIEKVVPPTHPASLWDDEKLMADNVSSGFISGGKRGGVFYQWGVHFLIFVHNA